MSPPDPPASAASLEGAVPDLERASWSELARLVPFYALLLAALYGPLVPELVSDWWTDGNYSHGFFVPLFSAWVVWQRRAELARTQPSGSWLGFPLLMAGAAAFVVGEFAAEYFVTRASLLLVLAGLVLFHIGRPAFRLLAFPLAFLAFMIPWPSSIFYAAAFPLQRFAARAAAFVLDRVCDVPVLLDGNILHLPQATLGVTEACSGVRSLLSLAALSVAWAWVSLRGAGARTLLVLSAIPITVAANAGRVIATGLIAQRFGRQYAEGFFHAFAGWLIFAAAFLMMLGVERLLAWRDRPSPAHAARTA